MEREIKIGNISIGGENKIAIQSMTNTKTEDIDKTVAQILALENAGADIVRFSVYNDECARAIRQIKSQTHVPLVADIHFDYKLAIQSIENGIDKLRINPGNIGSSENVKKVVDCAKAHGVPIRIGVNSGSVERDLAKKYGSHSKEALALSAMSHVKILEDAHFYDIVISVKASTVKTTIEAAREINRLCDYPQHIGVTESGLDELGLVKSAIGIGSLLIDGIGSTVRVSLTGDPVKEIHAAKLILQAAGLERGAYVDVVSCPTCGRTTGDLEGVVRELKRRLSDIKPNKKLTFAVMGCVVNGPGEAKEADMGIAFAKNGAAVFKSGEIAFSGAREETLERFYNDCVEMCKEA